MKAICLPSGDQAGRWAEGSALQESPAAAVGVDDGDPGLADTVPRAALKRDLLPVGRPNRIACALQHCPRAAAVGVHDAELVSVRGVEEEGDLRPVGRPGWRAHPGWFRLVPDQIEEAAANAERGRDEKRANHDCSSDGHDPCAALA